MEIDLPSDAELSALAVEVDHQLRALQSHPSPAGELRGGATKEATRQLPIAPEQEAVIVRETGEPFETFWQKYIRHARRDLCLPGGLLHEQWRKWKDLESKAAVRTSYVWLAAMGIPTGSIAPVAVAATVFLLNVAIKVGIETICEEIAAQQHADGTERAG